MAKCRQNSFCGQIFNLKITLVARFLAYEEKCSRCCIVYSARAGDASDETASLVTTLAGVSAYLCSICPLDGRGQYAGNAGANTNKAIATI